MNDVVVERCVLRLRRTAGWAWGDSADALLAAASRALPALIAARLPQAAADVERSVRLSTPVRVNVEISLPELVALGAASASGASLAASAGGALAQRLGSAVEHALARSLSAAVAADPAAAPRDAIAGDPDPRAPAPAAGSQALDEAPARRALRAWQLGGELETVLAALAPDALAALHDLVFPSSAQRDPAASIAARGGEPAAGHGSARDAALEWLRARLARAGALLAQDAAMPAARLHTAIDALLPPPAAGASLPAASAAATSVVAPCAAELAAAASDAEATSPPAEAVRAAPPALRSGTEHELRSALPFLLLPSLHHAGWLDAVAALFAAQQVAELGFALAAALAAKVAPPPEHGWLRTREDRRLIAVFAGCDEPPSDARLLAAAPRLAPILRPLDAVLHAALARARRSDAPLLLWRSARGFALLDGDGLASLASGAELPQVTAGALVIVPAACAEPAMLERLDLANARFVTDAAPTRTEPWRRFQGSSGPLWTNDTATPAALLCARCADFDDLTAHAAELVEALDARPAIPRSDPNALEASAALAATAALGDIAARLFPAERTTPVLALARFADLDARVRVDADCVRVRVPLGRRHADLLRHGFMTTIPAVPWLGGRALDLGGA